MQCPTCQTVVDDSQRFCPSCGTPLAQPSAGGAGEATDPMLGQVLGSKYKVVRLLGEGGMGAVYEGEQQLGTTVRKVAVKTLHPHLSRDPKVKARFEREVGTIAELEHPNTIQVFDFGSTPEGILYIVMEFLQGKSLADTLEKQGAMSPERTIDIFSQVCGSLEEAHRRGIVHRDLKPDNVVLVERAGKKDFVKVLDFGIAKRASEEDKNEQKLTQQGMVLGTPPYMSPEQFTGQPIDARSDIYSLGVMAYEMLTGKLPFRANTAFEWANQHMTQAPIPIESMAEGMRAPAAMRAAILRALAKAPGDRFQNVADFSAALAGKGAPPEAAAASMGRAKTEVGTPLDVAAAFGGAVPTPGAMPGAAPTPYTPASGNVAFPTPAAIPQPPPRGGRSGGGGGSKTPLLIAAGAIGLVSIGAIVLAMKGGSHPAPVVFDNGSQAAPATSLAPATASAAPDTPAAPAESTAQGSGDIPALVGGGAGGGGAHGGGGGAPPHPGPGPAPGPAPAPSKAGGGPGGGATPPPAPAPVPPAPAPAAPGYDGPECQKARRLKAIGQTKAAQAWVLACEARGGNPN
jgi:tRNA A-37 threonylcarbamoyl transferase component Bud32